MNPEGNKDTADFTKPKNTLGNSFSSALFYLSILFFIIGFNLSDVMVGNWYQQFMPNLGGKTIQDLEFKDSLTGFATARQTGDSSYFIRTLDGGDNWQIVYRSFLAMTQIQFVNTNTGYAVGAYLYKTINGGLNWSQVTAPSISPEELYVVSEDTIWIISSNSLTGGVYRTTNGGASWDHQINLGSSNPERIYMVDANLGFMSKATGQFLYRTSNSGINWISNSSSGAFNNMYFSDNLTGWKTGVPGGPGNLRKTTDGGLNWFDQFMPDGGNIVTPLIDKVTGINKDTLWGTGSQIITSLGIRGMINRTTNGGNTWLFQVPDSSYNNTRYNYVQFASSKIGWAYLNVNRGIHTTNSGDPVWYTGLIKISENIPENFRLEQNFPNPFNPRTIIRYNIKAESHVKLTVFDITGKEVQVLQDGNQTAGRYETDFMGKFLSSGVYFYRLEVTNTKGKSVYYETRKMLLVK